jgi:outer membrane usher protein
MTCLQTCRRALALLLLLGCAVAGAAGTPRLLIVDLHVNNQSMGEAFVVVDEAGNFYIDDAALSYWEIARPWPEPLIFQGGRYYGVNRFYGATIRFDPQKMELRLFMPAELMPTRRVSMASRDIEAAASDYGMFMDYDLNWLRTGSSSTSSAGGLFRPVFFGPFGNVTANLSYRSRSAPNDTNRFNVLELTYTRDDPERMRSLRVGDVVTRPGRLGRALRIGGVQIGTNFATQPMLITHPLPDFYGESAVPSALDIYVNGRLSRRQQVEPGSFVLEDVPVVNGLGQLQVVATDALGRTQVFTQDYYLSTDLLREGLSDYSVTVGALREDFGLQSFRYGDAVASATWRRGMQDNLTVEAHGEISDGIAMGATGMRYGIEAGGVFSSGLAVSSSDTGTGARWLLGFQRLATPVHFNVEVSGSTEDFGMVGVEQSAARVQALASAGRNFYERGAVAVSVVHQSFYDQASRTIWGLDYSTRVLDRVSVAANLSYLDSIDNDLRFGLRFFVHFGGNHSMSGNWSRGRQGSGGSLLFQRNMPMYSGYGYHVGVGEADGRFVDAGVSAQNDYGTYTFDVRRDELGGTFWQVGGRGSIATMGGMTRMSREITNAFAVVQVGNIEGVRVYSENVEVGRTNRNGQLLVPRLQPYVENQLSIEIDDLPLGAQIGATQRRTAPYSKSGVLVDFEVRVSTNALLRAVTPDGEPVPEGAIATVRYSGNVVPVGMDGKLFLQGIDRSSEVAIRWNGTSCDLDLPYPGGEGVIARMGDVVCVPRGGR